MARHKNAEWNIPDRAETWEQAGVAVLMDIRDQLIQLNSLLQCPNFLKIPHFLDHIQRNTSKKKKIKAIRRVA